MTSRMNTHGFSLYNLKKHDSMFSRVILAKPWGFFQRKTLIFSSHESLCDPISSPKVLESRPKAWTWSDSTPGNKQVLFSKALQASQSPVERKRPIIVYSLSLRIFLQSASLSKRGFLYVSDKV